MNSVLIGFGASLPKKRILNTELSPDLNTSDEWITRRTGIKQRYIASESETTSSLAVEAAKNALKHAKISADDIDLVVVATVTGDYTFPATATIVQRELGIKHGAAFDISAACSGFVYALDIVDSYIKTGKFKCALIIGAETFSRIVDWKDRSTCVLFGDGAGAVVVQAQETSLGVQYCKIRSAGEFIDSLKTSGGISTTQTSGVTMMEGREVFRFAIEKMNEALQQLLLDNNLSVEDIDLLVPHQANSRIIDKIIEESGITKEKVVVTLNKHANTSAASIPLALNEVKDELFKKKNVVLLSMGAGFTWGAALIKFSNNISGR
ncbi:MAG: ketoacyl-ACP synthase III [Alphaproteobacteria bacterium]|nr:ketoacyl-ACP synthase III [Alphaproteobacteria bacterium]